MASRAIGDIPGLLIGSSFFCIQSGSRASHSIGTHSRIDFYHWCLMLGLAEGQANRLMIHGGTRAFGAAYKIRDVVVQNSRPQGSTFVTLQKLGTSLDFQGAVRGMRGRAGNTKAPARMTGGLHRGKIRSQ